MLTVYNNKHLTWMGNTSINHYEMFIDSPADLPNNPYYFSTDKDSYKIAQGSLAWDISAGEMYMMNSSGAWIKQG